MQTIHKTLPDAAMSFFFRREVTRGHEVFQFTTSHMVHHHKRDRLSGRDQKINHDQNKLRIFFE